jgi:hypothetical protein
MATSVSTVFHGLAAGDTFTPAELRSGLLSRAGVVQDGSTAGKGRPGILPGAGTPLDVTQSSTPAMSVKVRAGTVIQTSADSPGGVYTHTLTTDTDLTIGTAPVSNSRWDAVVAKVFDDGASPVTTLEVLEGAAAPSPTYPAALTAPAPNTFYFPLAKVVVGTSVSSILNANISKPAAAGVLPTFGQFTAAPGGVVPVANLTAAAGLPLHTPFYSTSDRATGRVQLDSGGTKVALLDGHQLRFLDVSGAMTNSDGDLDMPFGVYVAGIFTPAPFPNGCFRALANDNFAWSSFDQLVGFKQHGPTQPSASSARFRAYTVGSGGPAKMATAPVSAAGIAWGW